MVDGEGSIHTEEADIRPPPHYRPDGSQQVVTSDTARQGPLGGRVLAGSLVLIGIAWVVVAALSGHGI